MSVGGLLLLVALVLNQFVLAPIVWWCCGSRWVRWVA